MALKVPAHMFNRKW